MNRINNDIRSRKALEEKNAYVAVNFYLLLNFIFPLFQTHYHTQKQRKNKI